MQDMVIPFGTQKEQITADSIECTVLEFKDELNSMTEPAIKAVTQEILESMMTSFKVSRRIIDYTKKVTAIAQALCDARGYTTLAKDVVTAAALLHDMYVKKYGDMHIFMIRYNHQTELRKLEPAIAENICSIIEAHHGYESIVPKVASKEGTIEQILTDAVVLAERI